MFGSSESWGPQQHPHPWHFRAGGGAVHSIKSGLMHRSKALLLSVTSPVGTKAPGLPSSLVMLDRNQGRPARTTHRAICDDRHHTNLVRTAPLLHADMIFGKDRC